VRKANRKVTGLLRIPRGKDLAQPACAVLRSDRGKKIGWEEQGVKKVAEWNPNTFSRKSVGVCARGAIQRIRQGKQTSISRVPPSLDYAGRVGEKGEGGRGEKKGETFGREKHEKTLTPVVEKSTAERGPTELKKKNGRQRKRVVKTNGSQKRVRPSTRGRGDRRQHCKKGTRKNSKSAKSSSFLDPDKRE